MCTIECDTTHQTHLLLTSITAYKSETTLGLDWMIAQDVFSSDVEKQRTFNMAVTQGSTVPVACSVTRLFASDLFGSGKALLTRSSLPQPPHLEIIVP